MIVMKFGGSSVASATTIEWVARIVKSRLEDQPVLVVSAMEKTTDRLVEMMQHAARGSAYSAWCLFEELRHFHFQEFKRLFGCRCDQRVGETKCAEVPRVARLAD
jgi:aspartate kinase